MSQQLVAACGACSHVYHITQSEALLWCDMSIRPQQAHKKRLQGDSQSSGYTSVFSASGVTATPRPFLTAAAIAPSSRHSSACASLACSAPGCSSLHHFCCYSPTDGPRRAQLLLMWLPHHRSITFSAHSMLVVQLSEGKKRQRGLRLKALSIQGSSACSHHTSMDCLSIASNNSSAQDTALGWGMRDLGKAHVSVILEGQAVPRGT